MHGNCSPTEPQIFDGSRAGLTLVNPKGKEYTYALRFEFETTNNEAEYEALLEQHRPRTSSMRYTKDHAECLRDHDRTATNGTRRHKVPSSGHRLLHKIGRRKAANINDREARGKIRVGIDSVQNTPSLHISLPPLGKGTGRSNEQENCQKNGMKVREIPPRMG
nr:reverse transcriptase domain-containing protein [Tanacetum cinerariifolium]